LGRTIDELSPGSSPAKVRLESDTPSRIMQISVAAGAGYALAITDAGEVFVWGTVMRAHSAGPPEAFTFPRPTSVILPVDNSVGVQVAASWGDTWFAVLAPECSAWCCRGLRRRGAFAVIEDADPIEWPIPGDEARAKRALLKSSNSVNGSLDMSCIQRAALWANLFTNINGDGLSGEPLPGDPRCWQGFQPSQYHPRVDCCFPPPRGNPACWDEGAFTYDNCCVEPHCSDLQRISDITEHIPTMEPWRLSPADPDNPIRLMGYVDKCFDVVAAYTMAVMTHHLRHAMYSYHNLTDPAQLDMRWHHYRSGFLIRNRLEEARSRGVKTDVSKLRKQLDQAKLLGTRIHRLAKNTAHLLPVLQEIRRHVDYLALNDSIAQGPNEIPLMSYAHRHHSQTGTD
ncbi:hypothetical protein FOL47_003226, partial [Perkinsus chesapeaki]